jgi:hypothetical protein
MSLLIAAALAHSVDTDRIHIVQQGQRIWVDAGVEVDPAELDHHVAFTDQQGTRALRGLTDQLRTEHGPVLRVQYELPAPAAGLQLTWELADSPTTVVFTDGTTTVEAVVSADVDRVQLYGERPQQRSSWWMLLLLGVPGAAQAFRQRRLRAPAE